MNPKVRIEKFAAGEIVFRQGDPGSHAYLVTEGAVELFATVEGEVRPLSQVGKHGLFGEMALLGVTRRQNTARTLEPTSGMIIDSIYFGRELEKSPALVKAMLRILAQNQVALTSPPPRGPQMADPAETAPGADACARSQPG